MSSTERLRLPLDDTVQCSPAVGDSVELGDREAHAPWTPPEPGGVEPRRVLLTRA